MDSSLRHGAAGLEAYNLVLQSSVQLSKAANTIGLLLLKTGLLLPLRLLLRPRRMPLLEPGRESLVREHDRVRGAFPREADGRALTCTPRALEGFTIAVWLPPV